MSIGSNGKPLMQMTPWYWSRIRFIRTDIPFQALAGNWVFFWVSRRCNHPVFPQTRFPMTTIGLDGIDE